jgi:hypothetical protein
MERQNLTPTEVAQDVLHEIQRRVRHLSTTGEDSRTYDGAMSVQYLAQAAAHLLECDRLARLTDAEIAARLTPPQMETQEGT